MYGTAKTEARAFSQLEAEAKAKARLFLKSGSRSQMPESQLHEAEAGFGFLPMSECTTFLGKWYMIYRSYTKLQKEFRARS